jgi:hypothetical protein
MCLEEFMGRYRVRKESGIAGRKPDRRAWGYDTFEAAEKEFNRELKWQDQPFPEIAPKVCHSQK